MPPKAKPPEIGSSLIIPERNKIQSAAPVERIQSGVKTAFFIAGRLEEAQGIKKWAGRI